MAQGQNRFEDDSSESGFRENVGGFGESVPFGARAGAGSGATGNDVTSSQTPGNPHSSRGFRRALMKSQSKSGGTLKGNIMNKTHSGGPGFKKPNYFAQGGKRHGMHIGSGAPHIAGADPTGADSGGGGGN